MNNNPQLLEDTNPFIDQKDLKNNDTIVIQIGSHSIKFGFASQYQPFVIPNVIAHLISPEKNSQIHIDVDQKSIPENFINCLNEIENDIVQKENKNKLAKKLAVLNINKTLETQSQFLISEIPERINEQLPDTQTSYKKMEQISSL